jgi:hypothetical protein
MGTRAGRGVGWVLAGLLAGVGTGAEAREERRWLLGVEASTDFPLLLGGRLSVEGPGRLRLSTSLGYLPPAYPRAVNDVAVRLDLYERGRAELIEDGLNRALVWRTMVGWRPFPAAGFYVDVGYGLVALGGEVNSEAVLAELTGITPPGGVADREYQVRSVLHMGNVELGWRWLLGSRWTARTGLGAAFTLDANSRVEPLFTPLFPPLTRAFTSLAEGYLDDTYQRFVHVPTLSFSLGYTF